MKNVRFTRLLKGLPLAATGIVCAWAFLPGLLNAQYLAYSFKANPNTGKQIYKAACASCHSSDGKGSPENLTVFKRPSTFPDFTRCDQTTAEVNTFYKAVIKYGGPKRGFSQIMPAFGQALSSEEIDDVIAYLASFPQLGLAARRVERASGDRHGESLSRGRRGAVDRHKCERHAGKREPHHP